jgi:hypothetical protein
MVNTLDGLGLLLNNSLLAAPSDVAAALSPEVALSFFIFHLE